MKYVEQSHKDLRLYLSQECEIKDYFTVISEAEFTEGDFTVSFGILTESHFATFQVGDVCFSEICACTDVTMPDAEATLLTDIGDANKAIVTENFSYKLNYKFTNMSVGEIRLKALQSKRPHPHCQYLEHVFPPAIPGGQSAVTELYITVGDSILVESVHTYPNNDAMVFTTSQLTKK